MNQTTMRHLSINAKSGLGVFKRAHLLERLSVMLLSLIDVKSRCVVTLMDGDVPYGGAFAAQRFLGELLEAQSATLVTSADDLGETGVRVTVGKAAEGELTLVDHGWFVLEWG